MRRLELRGDVDLSQESLGADGLSQVGTQDLDGDCASVPDVAGEVDGGHAAVTQLALHGVPSLKCLLQSGSDVAHRAPTYHAGRRIATGAAGSGSRTLPTSQRELDQRVASAALHCSTVMTVRNPMCDAPLSREFGLRALTR